MLTQKRLREVLHYDPKSGVVTWLRGRRKGRIAGTWHEQRGFLKVGIDGERHLLHRLAWLWMTGVWPRWHIEHTNGDHGDNRWSNLREGSRLQKHTHRAPTGSAGVWHVDDAFEAMVQLGDVAINLGTFITLEEASGAITAVQERALLRAYQNRRLAA